MRRRLVLIGAVAAVLVAGGAGARFLGLGPWAPRRDPGIAFVAKQAALVTLGPITANLAGGTHYVQLTVVFEVMPQALTQAGGAPGAQTGTGSALLDARIEAALTALCRQTPYASLQTAQGLQAFRQAVRGVLRGVFPQGLGPVWLPSVLTQ